jgi:DNA-binding CsgD family transcriptional regulator
MLAGGFTAVYEARNKDEFRAEIVRFTESLGFETFSAMTVVDQAGSDSQFITVDNTPLRYQQSFRDPSLGRRDPVMQHCKTERVPIAWDQSTYVRQGAADIWEHQAAYGISNGIALALHLPEDRHFLLGVDRAAPLPEDPIELQRLVADLQLFAVYAQDAALRILLPEAQQLERPKLTPRELEVLRWTLDGKTAWEVAQILKISERTAVLHLTNATHKLGANGKHQAAVKALRLGLIH